MTIFAQTIIQNVQDALNDLDGARYPASTLVRHLNKAQRWIQVVRPDTTSADMTWNLEPGFKQDLPPQVASLIDISANATGKRTRVTRVDQRLMDASVPNWRSQTPKLDIVHFMYDLRNPRHILVYPPAASGAKLDLEYSAYPQDVPTPSGDGRAFATVSGSISLADKWQSAVESLTLHFAYSKDMESPANAQLASAHLQMATQILGVELQAMQASAPKD